ncbi:hypothetical protein [Burkholderia sp. LMG 32019]|uniref:hypothetical protein n=1 Tax=Burkholderia sp. LMG 32019 TaxID=3158173 RepID=UPI003C2CE220
MKRLEIRHRCPYNMQHVYAITIPLAGMPPAAVRGTAQAQHRDVPDYVREMDEWRAERSGDGEARIDAIAPDPLAQSKTGA